MKGCDLWAATEGLSLNGCNQKTMTVDCQLKAWDWMIVTEYLGMNVKGCKWRVGTEVVTQSHGLKAKGCNWRTATEVLRLNGCH